MARPAFRKRLSSASERVSPRRVLAATVCRVLYALRSRTESDMRNAHGPSSSSGSMIFFSAAAVAFCVVFTNARSISVMLP
jgi:hypothetical protein